MNTATDSLESNTPKTGGGQTIFQSSGDLGAFYGATPVAQPSGASQAAVTTVTNSAGGTGSYTTGLQALSGTYNSTLIADSFKTITTALNANIALANQLRADLVTLGLIAGA